MTEAQTALPVACSNQRYLDIDEFREEERNISGGIAIQLDRGDFDLRLDEIAFTDLSIRWFRTARSMSLEAFFQPGWTNFILCPHAENR